MQQVTTIPELRSILNRARGAGKTVGLVPTMGYLHEGHQSLIRAAATECDVVVTTIFVNPLQFAEGEDLDSYPRDPEGDAAKADASGCDVLFVPAPDQMYSRGREFVKTTVSVADVSNAMEGESRPTHFAGVATVVAKLFFIVGECHAYFGEKDFQQLAVIRRMAHDLSAPVAVVGCPVVREPDGLALSSRNVYLTEEERAEAPVLNRALRHGAALISAGETDADHVRSEMAAMIKDAELGELDYVDVVDAHTLERQSTASPDSRLFGAVRFGSARLIDNIAASEVPPADGPVS